MCDAIDNGRPVADFDVQPARPRVGQSMLLTDASSDPRSVGIAWRAWDFGDGMTATGQSPSHCYRRDGFYTVTLTVATFDGRLATAERAVAVAPRAPSA